MVSAEEHFRYWSCERKRGYSTRKYARTVANRVAKETGNIYHIYRCRFCHCFHLATGKDERHDP